MLRWRIRQTSEKPSAAGRPDYERWILQRIQARKAEYAAEPDPGLFSLVTVVQEPRLPAFDELIWSVQAQDFNRFEWIVVDLGAPPPVLAKVHALARDARVTHLRVTGTRSQTVGLRLAAEKAKGRYLLPIDAEDRLYPDALRIAAAFLQGRNYPALAYSDEDRLPAAGGAPTNPFCKPDWDPLLAYAGGYAARLALLDRHVVLQANAFSDEAAEGCAVWDATCRLAAAGHAPAHLAEILYGRRVEKPTSALATPLRGAAAGHHVARGHLRRQRLAERVNLRPQPLDEDSTLWRVAWQRTDRDAPIPVFPLDQPFAELRQILQGFAQDSLAAFAAPGLRILADDWADEARALFAVQPDVVAASGCVLDEDDRILSAGEYFGIDGLVGSPLAGAGYRDAAWAGHARAWAQHTVGAPSRHFFIAEVGFIADLLRSRAGELSHSLLHAWVGADARTRGFRVAYSPHLLARRRGAADDARPSAEEKWRFLTRHWRQVLDDPAWSRFHTLESGRRFELASPHERGQLLSRTLGHLAGTPTMAPSAAVAEHDGSRVRLAA